MVPVKEGQIRGSYKRTPIEERFWKKVTKGPCCWRWIGAKNFFGYGKIGGSEKGSGWKRAHRVSWEIHNGPIPQKMLVLHKCDNPPCTNPKHLKLGTTADNIIDKCRKKRQGAPFGENHRSAKLKEAQVKIIKKSYSGSNCIDLAKRFNVSKYAIRGIVYGQTWKYLFK